MKCDRKGFTLSELLIVVAIIAVLAAVAFPIFNIQLKKVRLAVDHANIRIVQSMLAAANQTGEITIGGKTGPLEDFTKGYYCLSTDGTLISAIPGTDAYHFQETGVSDDGSPCPDCPGGFTDQLTGINQLHRKGLTILISIAKIDGSYVAFIGNDPGA